MKASFWRRWCKSLLESKSGRRGSRVKARQPVLSLQPLEDRVTPTLTPQMVLDINTNTLSSNPSQLVTIGSTTYFIADDGIHGTELWKSDGTAAGTALVKDINPGSAGAFDHNGYYQKDWLTNVNGTLFFVASDGTNGFELWKTDGTAAGTVLVKDINPASGSSSPRHLTNVNGTLFFSANDGTTGGELWKSDGTAAGTVLVKDIEAGSSSSGPRYLTNVNGTLFFSASSFPTEHELWKSDGTAAGTVLVKDIKPQNNSYSGSSSSSPRYLTNVNGTLFFVADDGTHGRELWKSDGTEAGTVLVKDIDPRTNWYGGPVSSSPRDLTDVNGTLFFSAFSESNQELWKSDGTADGTVMVKDIDPSNGSNPRNLTNVNGTLFFSASDGITFDELWKSDGTESGTVLVKDINTGSVGASNPGSLTNVNGTLYFTVFYSNVNGTPSSNPATELWKSDGTEAGTVMIKEFNSGSPFYSYPKSLTNANGALMFAAGDGAHGAELWKSDGTAAGTSLVKDINNNTLSSSPGRMADVNGTLFFAANDGVHGNELWKSDGTIAGTTLVKDIFPGGYTGYYGGYYLRSSDPSILTDVNGTLFFTVWSAGTGSQLWKSDGTEAGTVLVKQAWAGNLTNVNGTLFYVSDDGINGAELWKSDGTAAGTTMVKDIYPGSSWVYYGGYYGGWWNYVPNSSSPSNLTNLNGTLFFMASDAEHGMELWKSDGTAAGTVLVKDIWPGSHSASYGLPHLTDVNGTLFFSANDGEHGMELWKSDGTAAGTLLVTDLSPGSYWSVPHNLMNVNGTLFFVAHTAATGYELWKSDGTEAGTVLVKDIRPGPGHSYPGDDLYLPGAMAVVNGTLFFTANDGTHGRELWKSDGSDDGTVMVKDIYPGVGTVYTGPFHLTSVGEELFFVASDAIWQSDGTEAGTRVVADLYSNPGNSLINFSGTLFFSANDRTHGVELWKLVDDGQTQGTSLEVTGFPATVTAGDAGTFTVTARNADGTINTDYRGTVHFTSSDSQAVLPADYTFTQADQGVHTFSITLKTAGSQSITVRDTVTPLLADTQAGITVNPAAASRFTVAGFPTPATAGVAGSFTVTAWDAYGNRASNYTGTVKFTSTDAQAVLPASYTFTAADAGVHTFSATLKTAGIQSFTATDTANSALSGAHATIQVNAAAASRFILTAPSIVNADTRFSLTVTVVDAYGNIVTDYRGKIVFRSSDSRAKLPKKYAFTAIDQGVHTFTGLVLRKRGNQTVTVTDMLNNSIMGSVSIDVR